MVRVLLTVLLFGLSFSGQAADECDLEVGVSSERFFGKAVNVSNGKIKTIEAAERSALTKCRRAGFPKCTIVKSHYYRDLSAGGKRMAARVKVLGENRFDLSTEERRALMCERINQCIGNRKGSLEQLKALFEMNEC